MGSADQLQMFEPSGFELASLVRTHADTARQLRVKSENLALRGFLTSARCFAALSAESERASFECELALQFEQLAGLS